MFLWSFLSILIIALDQFTKYLTVANISAEAEFHIIPHILDFVYVQNTGAAFSFFSGRVSVLGILSLLFCIALPIYCYKKRPKNILSKIALMMIFAGAFGNGIDRLFRGYVVDFIKVTFINFPVFNIADIAITLGAALLIIFVVFFDKE